MSYNALQIQVANGLIHDQVLKPLPAALTAAIAAYNATTLITNFLAAVAFYKSQSFATDSTLDSLLSIGDSVCPALGNSVPVTPVGTYAALTNLYLDLNPDDSLDPNGLANFVQSLGEAYLGQNNNAIFAQGFNAVAGFIDSTNQFVLSAVQANQYLGPTFTSLDNLYTSNVSEFTSDIAGFAQDLKASGSLLQFDQLDHLGEPATLLQSLAAASKGGILPQVYEALLTAGLSPSEISDLVSNNRQSLFNQTGLTATEFDQLQKRAYPALASITQDRGLADALQILDVTTPNIESLADLLNPVKIFPTSFQSLHTPTNNGPTAIYQANGALSPGLEQAITEFSVAPVGCEELGKIIPPETAVANQAVSAGLSQINNVVNSSPQQLWESLRGYSSRDWNPVLAYLANDLVLYNNQNYRAQQDVEPGIDITNTQYWAVDPVDGVTTPTTGLDLLQAQTAPLASAVVSQIAADVATGTGADGTVTFCDILGIATDHNDLASRFVTATTTINALQTAGVLAALNTALTNIVTRGTDAAVIGDIAAANAAIVTIQGTNPADVTVLNTAWTYVAASVNSELIYQNSIPVNYFDAAAGQGDIFTFAQNITVYGQNSVSCGARDFLQQIADTTTLGGQSMVAALTTAHNQQRLNNANIGTVPYTVPDNMPITQPNAVVP